MHRVSPGARYPSPPSSYAAPQTGRIGIGCRHGFGRLLERAIPVIAHTPSAALSARSGIDRLCRSRLAAESVREAVDAYTAACSNFTAALGKTTGCGCFSTEHKTHFQTTATDEVCKTCEAIAVIGPRLQRWCFWVQARDEARAHGLTELANAVESGRLAPTELCRAFEVNYSRWCLNHVVSSDDVLRTFISAEHEKQIADFQSLDDHYTALTRDWIRAKLCASTPSAESATMNSEWGTLRRELTKKKRLLPLRELMARIPSVVTTLTPCLLMSPLSIAQYLAVSTAAFDIVVFDEASQITVWDPIA